MARLVWKTAVTKTAATITALGDGLTTGMRREEGGKTYVLVQNGTSASGTIADGLALMPLTGQTTTGATTVLKVVITTGATVPVAGANNTGIVIPGDHFFWAIAKGRGYCLGGTIGDGLAMAPAANGLVGAAAATSPCGYTISDVTTTVANAVMWDCGAGGPQA